GVATFVVSDLPVGVHSLTATYGGSRRVLASSSEPVSHEVTESGSGSVPAPSTPTTSAPPTDQPSVQVADQGADRTRSTGGSLPSTGSNLGLLWLGLGLVAGGAVIA